MSCFQICFLSFPLEFHHHGRHLFFKDLALILLPNGFSLSQSIQPLCLHRSIGMYEQSFRAILIETISTWIRNFSCWSDWVDTAYAFHNYWYLIIECVIYIMMFFRKIFIKYTCLGRGLIRPNFSSNFLNEASMDMIQNLGRKVTLEY